MDKFLNASYKRVACDNFGPYLESMGFADQIRDLVLAHDPVLTLTKNGNVYCCKTTSPVRDHEMIFTPGEEFDHVGIDGRTYRAIVTIDGNKMTNQILSDPKSTIISEFFDDKMVVNFETNGVEASQVYEKI